MRIRVLLSVVLTALLAGALTAGVAMATKEPKAPKECNKPRVEPTKIVITCADFGLFVADINWKYWGAEKAKASGTLVEQCTPGTCTGTREWYVKLTLQKVRSRNCDGYHGKIFKTLKLNFPRAAPPFAGDIQKNRLFCLDK